MIDRRRLAIGLGAMALGALISGDEIVVSSKSIEDFGRRLRGLTRGLWKGEIDKFGFVDSMSDAIERGFNQAWTEGARSCGIEPSERTPEEEAKLREMINGQLQYLPGLADYIMAHSKFWLEGGIVTKPTEEIPPTTIPPSYSSSTPIEEVARLKDEWESGFSEQDSIAIKHWGQSGIGMRKLQSGDMAGLAELSRVEAESARRLLSNWEDVLERGVRYEGDIVRGLSQVPYNGVISDWMESGIIGLTNDQSATKLFDVAKEFTGTGSSEKNSVMWEIRQSTGIDLFGNTKVTYGGKSVAEHEIIMRKGTRYRIESIDYMFSNGKMFDSADFFEGTDFSWPDNPPEVGWHPGKNRSGTYIFKLVEILT